MAKATYILLLSDNPQTAKNLTGKLNKEGFVVDIVADAESVLTNIRQRTYDLIVLNAVSLGMKGLDLCRTLKNDPQTGKIPIIIIAVTKDEVDTVLSLEIGADDYMTEPVNIKELAARINAVMRRTRTPVPDIKVLQRGDIVIDTEKCVVKKNGRRVVLTAQAYKLLRFLAEKQGKVFSREQLRDEVWNRTTFVGLRTIDVHIRKLREKLEQNPSHPQYIKTFRGIGYFFERGQLPQNDDVQQNAPQ
jgi:DNA-binding response OmpR family regulator